ncbi:hypothetical protein V2J09_012276 [Rumex salicifolius]
MDGEDERMWNDEPLLPIRRAPSRDLQLLTAKSMYVVLGPVLCLLICCLVELEGAAANMLGVLAWVFTWWLTEAVPMPVASMSPLFLFPMLGISSADHVASTYMDDVISLVLGSFILALAVQHYNIHKRLALNITMLFCGEAVKPSLLLLGICATTAFVSMWMHNVAAAVMMMPVATGILQRLPEDGDPSGELNKFCRAVVLGVIYSAAVGGMSTLTGTGVNLILVGMWKSYFPEANPISFNTWFFFAFPLALLIFVCMWAIICFFYCSNTLTPLLSAHLDRAHLKRELQLLGAYIIRDMLLVGLVSLVSVFIMHILYSFTI